MKGVKIFEVDGSGVPHEVGRFWLEGNQLRASPRSHRMNVLANRPIWDQASRSLVTVANGAAFLHNLQFAYRGVVTAGAVAELDAGPAALSISPVPEEGMLHRDVKVPTAWFDLAGDADDRPEKQDGANRG